MLWLYMDTKDVAKVSALATSIFWLVLPSLALFVTLPLFLKQGWDFHVSIATSIGITVGCCFSMVCILTRCGMKL